MNEQVVALLEAGLGLIPTPDRWTKKWVAKNAQGTPCASTDTDAVCFCSFGALNRGLQNTGLSWRTWDAASAILDVAFGGCYVRVNESPETTHADIVAGWKRAIQFAKEATP